ncbi:hypothetical protein Godav_000421 [Gossypium davidsonii]|uniref:Magnesium transporter n=2 Tax=Gossypium TaxID=3633 RepID=A0A7J8SZM1_GOSDV|nr:hypothetical protein [Gossypium davidsonii]MBA0667264.1 hypothetical protein [Gossypium klotzschianum]
MQGVSTVDVSDSELHVLASEQLLPVPEVLPFEFQVLEIALEVVCSFLDKNVTDLERDAYPALDELARNVSTKNLEHVRSLKSSLTHMLARVQKVRDEIEHLLNDNGDMAHLYLTIKRIQNQQSEAVLSDAFSNSIAINPPHLRQLVSNRSRSLSSHFFDDHNVEDLEMLLEAYFVQLDGIRNKILLVSNSSLPCKMGASGFTSFDLVPSTISFFRFAGWMGMNIPCALYQKNGIFEIFSGGLILGCLLIFLLVLEYARWTKLIDA